VFSWVQKLGQSILATGETVETTSRRIANTRIAADRATVGQQLGLLADLEGTWEGKGFNLIARPNFHDNANTYLQLNQTHETLTIRPIGTAIPNRGFGQNDIELYGLSYLQKISDASTGGALHFETGLWMTQPTTSYPPESPQPGDQIVFRMGSIPHGTSILVEGTATSFDGLPVVTNGGPNYSFSAFPSFNTTPFAAGTPVNAATSSDAATAAAAGAGAGFSQYDMANPASLANPRTPFDTDPPEPQLPQEIDGVSMQSVVNDPIVLLQAVVESQIADGAAFSGVALNIATQPQIKFLAKPNDPKGPVDMVNVVAGGGGLGNIPFLDGGNPTGAEGPNAETALVYATFWIEQVAPCDRAPFMQLQYAQFTVLDFPIFAALHPAPGGPGNATVVNFSWPHVSVATLRKTFS
jgi:hypothetical protein